MISSQHVTLYLSRDGDSLEIINDSPSRPRTHSLEQVEASSCKTHAQVLAFLNKIAVSELRKSIIFYHAHNLSYMGHSGETRLGLAHPCSLDNQIEFVRVKILEQKRFGCVPQRYFSSCVIL